MKQLDNDRALLRRTIRHTKGFRRHIVVVALLSLAGAPLALLTPIPLKVAVDSVLGDQALPGVVQVIAPSALENSSFRVLLLAALLQVVVITLMQAQAMGLYVLQTLTEERMTLRLRARLMNHAQKLSFAFHDDRGTADSIYRIQYDAPAPARLAVQSVIPLLTAFVTLVAMAVVILRIDAQLALVAMVVMPLLYVLGRSYRVRMRPRYRDAKALESSALNAVQEILGSLRVVKAFGRESFEEERFVGRADQSARAKVGLSAAEAALAVAVSFATACGTGAVLLIGVRGVEAGRLTLGELLMVLGYLGQLYGPVQTISKQVASVQNHLASLERVFDLLDEIPEVQERPRARRLDRAKGEIELQGVSASYGDGPLVLHDIDLRVRAGARIGIRGPTGAGKTTLVSLLTRFIDPIAGRITLDGVDLRDYALADLRRQYSIMLQEPLLFSTSVRENIAYARPGAADSDILAASRAAGAHGFISSLPDGYDTIVGERGLRLSGGERQRVSLARAFLRDAPVLILDEPTSSVDVRTELGIMEAMDGLMAGRTTFMIAHRLSTLESCDAVLEIDAGRVVGAAGDRDDLVIDLDIDLRVPPRPSTPARQLRVYPRRLRAGRVDV